jgi:hypothetical protein
MTIILSGKEFRKSCLYRQKKFALFWAATSGICRYLYAYSSEEPTRSLISDEILFPLVYLIKTLISRPIDCIRKIRRILEPLNKELLSLCVPFLFPFLSKLRTPQQVMQALTINLVQSLAAYVLLPATSRSTEFVTLIFLLTHNSLSILIA